MANSGSTQPVNGAELDSPVSSKGKKSHQQPDGGTVSSSAPSGTKGELSNAEKKKLQKEEKAARRAKEKQTSPAIASSASSVNTSVAAKPMKGAGQASGLSQGQLREDPQRRRRESTVAQPTAPLKLPSRSTVVEKSRPSKSVRFFTHLHGQPRRRTLEGTGKEVHPAIYQLALQISSYTLCGSHCRGVAMLLAIKSVSQLQLYNLRS